MLKKLVFLLFVGLIIVSCTITKINKKDANILPSKNPPGGLKPEEVPQFVCFGFDDNSYSGYPGSGGDGGMLWAINLFKNKKMRMKVSVKQVFIWPVNI